MPSSRGGFVLITVLICLLLVALLAFTAASLAWLARRSSSAALATARAEALAEADPAVGSLPIPPVAGQILTLSGTPPDPGWLADWTVTRLGGNLLMVEGSARLPAPGGRPVSSAVVVRLVQCCDSLPPSPLPGGWLGIP
jgi:hypothetical protein